MWSGLLSGQGLDPPNVRVIMQYDPAVLDPQGFTRAVRAIVEQANVDAHVRGPKLTVTV